MLQFINDPYYKDHLRLSKSKALLLDSYLQVTPALVMKVYGARHCTRINGTYALKG